MKRTTALLLLSLAANVALGVAFFLQRAPNGSVTTTRQGVTPPRDLTPAATPRAALAAAFAAGDEPALRAAGVPAATLRQLAAARAYAKMEAVYRTKHPAAPAQFWRKSPAGVAAEHPTVEQRNASAKAEREFADAMRAAFGEETMDSQFSPARFSFLPAATRETVRRIQQDYEELRAEIRDPGSLSLPSDRAKLALLDAEEKRDVLAAMTAQERIEDDLRSSPTADAIKYRWGDAIQTEDEYRKIFALQRSLEPPITAKAESEAPPSAEEVRAREAAQRRIDEQVRDLIGPARFAAFVRANDPDTAILSELTARLALPATAADEVFALRETYAAQSMAINADPSLSAELRRARLIGLVLPAKLDLATKLGAEGAEVLGGSARWIATLANGRAFSTSIEDAAPRAPLTSAIFEVPTKH